MMNTNASNKIEKTERDTSLDIVAGLLILYTMLIHTCPQYGFGEFVRCLHYIFFYFMAWFFFKTGMFFNWHNDIKGELKYSAKRLVVPLITFSLFGIILDNIKKLIEGDAVWVHYILSPLKEFVYSGYTNANSALWFLPTMIVVRIIGTQISKVPISNRKLSLVTLATLNAVIFILLNQLRKDGIITLPIYCYNVPLALVFFLTGGVMKSIHNNNTCAIASLIACLFLMQYNFSHVAFMNGTLIEGNSEITFILECLFAIISIDGIARLAKKIYSFPILQHFGRNTLAYFGLHMPIIMALNFCNFPRNSSMHNLFFYIAVITIVFIVIQAVRLYNIKYLIGEKPALY